MSSTVFFLIELYQKISLLSYFLMISARSADLFFDISELFFDKNRPRSGRSYFLILFFDTFYLDFFDVHIFFIINVLVFYNGNWREATLGMLEILKKNQFPNATVTRNPKIFRLRRAISPQYYF